MVRTLCQGIGSHGFKVHSWKGHNCITAEDYHLWIQLHRVVWKEWHKVSCWSCWLLTAIISCPSSFVLKVLRPSLMVYWERLAYSKRVGDGLVCAGVKLWSVWADDSLGPNSLCTMDCCTHITPCSTCKCCQDTAVRADTNPSTSTVSRLTGLTWVENEVSRWAVKAVILDIVFSTLKLGLSLTWAYR